MVLISGFDVVIAYLAEAQGDKKSKPKS